MAVPEFTVEIGFTSSLANLLVFPFSFQDVDGTVQTLGVFGNQFSNWFDGTYDDVSEFVDGEVRIRRGRDNLLTTMQAGTCSFALCDPADPGKFNPQNPDSVIVQEVPGLVPMRPVRISATYSGTTYGLFYGFIQSAEFSMDGTVGKLQLDCVDLFLWLSRVRPQDPDAFIGGSPTEGGDAATVADAGEVDTVAADSRGFVRTASI
jgi:hypothetical protein